MCTVCLSECVRASRVVAARVLFHAVVFRVKGMLVTPFSHVSLAGETTAIC